MKVIRRTPRIDSDSTEGTVIENLSGDVEFRSVEFAYPSRPENIILRGFDLKVPAGKTVALVGSSGSGKSTVIALMERFYDPLGGEILLDGVDIRSIKLKWLRSQIGLVSQEPALFATSIKENLLFGKEEATVEEVVAAATASNAHNFIAQLPQGYDTQVGESGVQMSGGQKQRIAIARAVLKSPRILLLDEATSALDSESERVVQEALDLASLGRTTIVVAHRLSTIRNADVIAVVQAGRVAELGSHDDLIRDEDGLYSSLVRFQQTAGAAGSDAPSSSSAALVAFPRPGSSESRRLSLCSRSSSTSSSRHQESQEESEADAPPPVPSLRRLLLLNLQEWRQAVLGSLGAMAFGAVQPLYAFSMGSMLSVYFMNDHKEIRSNTRTYCLIFVAMSVLSFLVNILQHYNFAAMGEYLTRRVRQRMLSKILTFEVGWFDRDENSTGAICSRLANDANVVRMLVGDRMSLIIQAVSAVTIAWTLGLVIAWKLALILIAIQPLMIACYYSRMVILKSMSKKAIESQSESSKVAAEAPVLFAGSIRENIAYGMDGPTEGEIEDAARTANAHDFISGLNDGYDTFCGERGVQLSGGQKQRIAIARAVLKNPVILLLDEATSALDSQSEKVVQAALERVMAGRTSVVVAHRLSTIRNCDLIAVMEKGVVVEKGTHASLLAKGPKGSYCSFVSLQQGNK
ncbi:unnamed protein product, partial [Musa hybrid cultivar]